VNQPACVISVFECFGVRLFSAQGYLVHGYPVRGYLL